LAKSRLTFQKRQKELARIRKREDKKKRMAERRPEPGEEGEERAKGPQIASTEDLVGLGLAEPEEIESEDEETSEDSDRG
jgi:hypothetical protein